MALGCSTELALRSGVLFSGKTVPPAPRVCGRTKFLHLTPPSRPFS